MSTLTLVLTAVGSVLLLLFLVMKARMQKVAVEKRGMQLMRHFAGDSGFSAAGNAHQNVDVVIMISRAQSILPPDRYAAPWLTH